MNSKRLYFVMIGLVFLLTLGLIGGAYFANSLLQKGSSKLVDNKLQSALLAKQRQNLAIAKQDVEKYTSLEKTAKSIVPQDKDQAVAVREIANIARQNGIKLGSITFPSSTLGGTTPTVPGATSTAPTAPTVSPALSQLIPVPNIAGVYSLQINVQSDTEVLVSYDKFLSFLDSLEHNRRTAQVNSITLQPDKDNPNFLSFSLILNEYIKP